MFKWLRRAIMHAVIDLLIGLRCAMGRRRTYGFSFSWKRALGISAAKARLSRKIGIPLTKSGRERKAGRNIGSIVLVAFAVGVAVASRSNTSNQTNEPSGAHADVAPTFQPEQAFSVQQRSSRLNSVDKTIVPRGNEKPSFDCARAITPSARLICADAQLAKLDGLLGIVLQKRKVQMSSPDQSKFIAEQLAWIRGRNARCGLDGRDSATLGILANSKPCMMLAIQERIAVLAQPALPRDQR